MFDQKFVQDPETPAKDAPESSTQGSGPQKDDGEKEPAARPCKNSLPT